MQSGRLLIAEDEEVMRNILRQLFEAAGYEVFTADTGENALNIFAENLFDAVLTDIKMPGISGIDLLGKMRAIDPLTTVVVLTAFSSVDSAVSALRNGAYDYVTKPFINDDLLHTVKNAVAQRKLSLENRALRNEINRQFNFSEIVGQSVAIRSIFETIEKVAGNSVPVLITGETGTGKELVARAIHLNGKNSDGPFLAVNCGALSESLLESELFGHVKGAFTGAVSDRKGFFRSAESGTVFLDEIGEMSTVMQVKLLRALQERVVTPVGSDTSLSFNARIIAATNRDLEAEIANGAFRQDLFFRLNVVELNVPPLRDRPTDIPILARHFSARVANLSGRPAKPIEPAAMDALMSYSWPGNVRELENCIERASVMGDETISVYDLPPKIIAHLGDIGVSKAAETKEPGTLESIERNHILAVLEKFGHDKVRTAKALGIDLSTLYRKLKRFPD